ncbi:MAG: PEGA domain-containing protein [Elusimicrobia bacterium]|jgi:hypothetical protein|nr:PEGA domain-containing protein [Elusimicrobiota bacterium]
MKKIGLLIVLGVNFIILIVTGYLLYNYLAEEKSPAPPPVSSDNISPPFKEKAKNKEDLKPKEGPAEVKIVSIPADAKVFVNGYYKGKTPVKFKIVSASGVEKPRFTLIKAGYKKWNRKLEIISGRTKEYRVILEKD